MDLTFQAVAQRASGPAGQSTLESLLDSLDTTLDVSQLKRTYGQDLATLKIKLNGRQEAAERMAAAGKDTAKWDAANAELTQWIGWLQLQQQQQAGQQQQQAGQQQQQAGQQQQQAGQQQQQAGQQQRQQQQQQQQVGQQQNTNSKGWLQKATQNLFEQPKQDFSGLNADPDDFQNNPPQPNARRGAMPSMSRGARLLHVSVGAQGASKPPAPKGIALPEGKCQLCNENCASTSLKRIRHEGLEKWACFECAPPEEEQPGAVPHAAKQVTEGAAWGTGMVKLPKLKGGAGQKGMSKRLAGLSMKTISPGDFHGSAAKPALRSAAVGWPALHLQKVGAEAPGGEVRAAGAGAGTAGAAGPAPGRRQGEEQRQKGGVISQVRGTGRQRPPPQQQQQQHNVGSDDDWQPGQFGQVQRQRNPSSRQAAKRKAQEHDGTGTADNPINVLSDDDDHAAPAAAAAAALGRPARLKAAMTTSQKFEGLKCLYPPPGAKDTDGAVEVTALDLSRLDNDEFLNDTVIDFYLRWLRDRVREELGEGAAARCHFFNSFFYKKLTENNGGSLPDDMVARMTEGNYSAQQRQALRNHQKVKNWTKTVDVFSKDYLIVPIHDALHWSLAIICHPGAEPTDDKSALKTPCILHLDSMSGGHTTETVARLLRLYLTNEWNSKALDPEARGVPKQWQEAHPGEERQFNKDNIPNVRLKVPQQSNFCDCGLFLCTYADFFLHPLPQGINYHRLASLKDYPKHLRDLFEEKGTYYPGFLTTKWFQPSNASNLRYELRRMIVRLMAEQGEYAVPEGSQLHFCTPEQADEMEPRRREIATRLKQEWSFLESFCAGAQHQRPAALLEAAKARKADQLAKMATEAQRKQEEKEEKARRKSEGAGALPQPVPADRDRLAAAAEKRAGGTLGAGGGDSSNKRAKQTKADGAKRVEEYLNDSQEEVVLQLGSGEMSQGGAGAPEAFTTTRRLSEEDEGEELTPTDRKRRRQRSQRGQVRMVQASLRQVEDWSEQDGSGGDEGGGGAGGSGGGSRQEGPAAWQCRVAEADSDYEPVEEGQEPAVQRRGRRGSGRQGKAARKGHQGQVLVDTVDILSDEGLAPPAARQQQQQQQQQHEEDGEVVLLLGGTAEEPSPQQQSRQQAGCSKRKPPLEQHHHQQQPHHARQQARKDRCNFDSEGVGDAEVDTQQQQQQQQPGGEEAPPGREDSWGDGEGAPDYPDCVPPTQPVEGEGFAGGWEGDVEPVGGGLATQEPSSEEEEDDVGNPLELPGEPNGGQPEWGRVIFYNTQVWYDDVDPRDLETFRITFTYEGGGKHIVLFPGDAKGVQQGNAWLQAHKHLMPERCHHPPQGNGLGATPHISRPGSPAAVAAAGGQASPRASLAPLPAASLAGRAQDQTWAAGAVAQAAQMQRPGAAGVRGWHPPAGRGRAPSEHRPSHCHQEHQHWVQQQAAMQGEGDAVDPQAGEAEPAGGGGGGAEHVWEREEQAAAWAGVGLRQEAWRLQPPQPPQEPRQCPVQHHPGAAVPAGGASMGGAGPEAEHEAAGSEYYTPTEDGSGAVSDGHGGGTLGWEDGQYVQQGEPGVSEEAAGGHLAGGDADRGAGGSSQHGPSTMHAHPVAVMPAAAAVAAAAVAAARKAAEAAAASAGGATPMEEDLESDVDVRQGVDSMHLNAPPFTGPAPAPPGAAPLFPPPPAAASSPTDVVDLTEADEDASQAHHPLHHPTHHPHHHHQQQQQHHHHHHHHEQQAHAGTGASAHTHQVPEETLEKHAWYEEGGVQQPGSRQQGGKRGLTGQATRSARKAAAPARVQPASAPPLHQQQFNRHLHIEPATAPPEQPPCPAPPSPGAAAANPPHSQQRAHPRHHMSHKPGNPQGPAVKLLQRAAAAANLDSQHGATPQLPAAADQLGQPAAYMAAYDERQPMQYSRGGHGSGSHGQHHHHLHHHPHASHHLHPDFLRYRSSSMQQGAAQSPAACRGAPPDQQQPPGARFAWAQEGRPSSPTWANQASQDLQQEMAIPPSSQQDQEQGQEQEAAKGLLFGGGSPALSGGGHAQSLLRHLNQQQPVLSGYPEQPSLPPQGHAYPQLPGGSSRAAARRQALRAGGVGSAAAKREAPVGVGAGAAPARERSGMPASVGEEAHVRPEAPGGSALLGFGAGAAAGGGQVGGWELAVGEGWYPEGGSARTLSSCRVEAEAEQRAQHNSFAGDSAEDVIVLD